MSEVLRTICSSPDRLVLSIPIVGIIMGGLIAIVSMVIKHRERIALINQGIHPDYPPEEVEDDPGTT